MWSRTSSWCIEPCGKISYHPCFFFHVTNVAFGRWCWHSLASFVDGECCPLVEYNAFNFLHRFLCASQGIQIELRIFGSCWWRRPYAEVSQRSCECCGAIRMGCHSKNCQRVSRNDLLHFYFEIDHILLWLLIWLSYKFVFHGVLLWLISSNRTSSKNWKAKNNVFENINHRVCIACCFSLLTPRVFCWLQQF